MKGGGKCKMLCNESEVEYEGGNLQPTAGSERGGMRLRHEIIMLGQLAGTCCWLEAAQLGAGPRDHSLSWLTFDR